MYVILRILRFWEAGELRSGYKTAHLVGSEELVMKHVDTNTRKGGKQNTIKILN